MKQHFAWILIVALMSCAQTKYVAGNDTVTNTNRYHGHHERDSIYLHDSIYVREYIKGDTVFRDKLVEHWKDRWLTRIDTLTQKDTTMVYQPVEVVKEVKHVPGFYKWCTALFWLLIAGVIGKIVFRKLMCFA